MSQLQQIDPQAIQVTSGREIINIFSGWDDRYATEPFLEDVTVYLDLNNNGLLDPGEPQQKTQKNQDFSLLGENPYYYTSEPLMFWCAYKIIEAGENYSIFK